MDQGDTQSPDRPAAEARPQDGAAAAARRALADELIPLFYADVKRLARRERMRGARSPTLQTTVLVHEAFLKLRSGQGFFDRAHFLRAAALAMRHALLTHAAERLAAKRGGGAVHVTLSHARDITIGTDEGLLALDDALERLAEREPRLAEVVECRYFAGYDDAETAEALGISVRTVHRDFLKAKAWLFRELGGAE